MLRGCFTGAAPQARANPFLLKVHLLLLRPHGQRSRTCGAAEKLICIHLSYRQQTRRGALSAVSSVAGYKVEGQHRPARNPRASWGGMTPPVQENERRLLGRSPSNEMHINQLRGGGAGEEVGTGRPSPLHQLTLLCRGITGPIVSHHLR